MPKKCIICNNEAEFEIKGSAESYCKECALEHFGDLSLLIKVDEQAKALKKALADVEETFEQKE